MIEVSVVLAEAHRCQRVTLTLPKGTQARAAVRLIAERRAEPGIRFQDTGADPEHSALGVYSIRVADDYVLQAGDRLEVYRALEQNPMELRRRRARSRS